MNSPSSPSKNHQVPTAWAKVLDAACDLSRPQLFSLVAELLDQLGVSCPDQSHVARILENYREG